MRDFNMYVESTPDTVGDDVVNALGSVFPDDADAAQRAAVADTLGGVLGVPALHELLGTDVDKLALTVTGVAVPAGSPGAGSLFNLRFDVTAVGRVDSAGGSEPAAQV